MRQTVEGSAASRYVRGKYGALALAAALLATGLLGLAVARRRATPAAGSAAAPRVIRVKAGDDLRRALDQARPGDTLVLEAGATFVGPFTLSPKTGDGWVTVQSSALDSLPGEGQRVSPSDAPGMPKVVSPGRGEPAVRTAPGAHHFRFVGIEFTTEDPDALVYDLVRLGGDDAAQDTTEEVPHHLVLDRCYVHAHPSQSLKRGVALNSGEAAILNSYVAGFKVKGQEAQAVMGWNGPGPFRIVNNYLEGAGENLMFGGGLPTLVGVIPSDIEIRRNHFAKPPGWRGVWSVKNLLELKNARRVVIDGNLFEYNWTDAQQGYAILLTPRTSGAATAVVEDVSFTNNVVRHVAAVFHVAGQDDLSADPKAHRLRRIRIANNLFEDVDGGRWTGDGAFLKIGQSADQVTIDHNTVLHAGNITKAFGDPNLGFVFTNNLLAHNAYGVMGDNQSPGMKTIAAYFPGGQFRGNVFAGAEAHLYPPGNFFPPTLAAAGLAGAAAGNYRLAPSSPFRARATDGRDVGCDLDALEAAASQPATRPRTVSRPR